MGDVKFHFFGECGKCDCTLMMAVEQKNLFAGTFNYFAVCSRCGHGIQISEDSYYYLRCAEIRR